LGGLPANDPIAAIGVDDKLIFGLVQTKTGTGTSPERIFAAAVNDWLGGESPFLNHA